MESIDGRLRQQPSNRMFSERWQDVFDSQDLREGALAPFLQAQPAECDPLIKHRFKGVLCRITNRTTLLFTMLIRIDALSNQGTRLITASTRFFETDLRVTA